LQQFAVVQRLQEGHRVGKRPRRHDAVEKAGIGVGDQILLHRAARAPWPEVNSGSELLDEMLLDLAAVSADFTSSLLVPNRWGAGRSGVA
jgi:hypothetical protein